MKEWMKEGRKDERGKDEWKNKTSMKRRKDEWKNKTSMKRKDEWKKEGWI